MGGLEDGSMERIEREVDINSLTFEMTEKLKVYLNMLIDRGGSDLHVKSGATIRGRVNGEMLPLSDEKLSYQDGLSLAKELLRGRFWELVDNKSVDFTYKFDKNYRFRVNLFFQVEGVSAVFRVIPNELPTFEKLKLPPVIETLSKKKRGLILVTGPTGSGKTTTLAAIINQINSTRKEHIITVEDPVEYIYKDKLCIVNQRAIGQDALDFSSALRAALREDPDIILVGEMRDLETIETALHAAETGHLVLSTLHTNDAQETINRIIGMFPGEEHNRITMSLAAVLQGIISQRLVRSIGPDGKEGRRAAIEVLVKNKRIEDLILEGNDALINDVMRESAQYGNQTFDRALLNLYAEGAITAEEAMLHSSTPNDLKLELDKHDASVKMQRENAKLGGAGQSNILDDEDIFELKR